MTERAARRRRAARRPTSRPGSPASPSRRTVVVSRATLRLASGRFQTRSGHADAQGGRRADSRFRRSSLDRNTHALRRGSGPVDSAGGPRPRAGTPSRLLGQGQAGERNAVVLYRRGGHRQVAAGRAFWRATSPHEPHLWIECHCAPLHAQQCPPAAWSIWSSESRASAARGPRRAEAAPARSGDRARGSARGTGGRCWRPPCSFVAGVASAIRRSQFAPSSIQYRRTLRGAPRLGSLALASEQPLVVLVEDLQWCDRSTLELLALRSIRRHDALPCSRRALPLGLAWRRLAARDAHPVSQLSIPARPRTLIDGITRERPLPARAAGAHRRPRPTAFRCSSRSSRKMVLESGLMESRRRSRAQPVTPTSPPHCRTR